MRVSLACPIDKVAGHRELAQMGVDQLAQKITWVPSRHHRVNHKSLERFFSQVCVEPACRGSRGGIDAAALLGRHGLRPFSVETFRGWRVTSTPALFISGVLASGLTAGDLKGRGVRVKIGA